MTSKKDAVINMKVYPDEKKLWQTKAKSMGYDLTNFIRFACNSIIYPQKIQTGANTEELDQIKDEIGNLSNKIKSLESKIEIPESVELADKKNELTKEIIEWILTNKPRTEKELPQIPSWYEGTPSAYETAFIRLKKYGQIKGTRIWKYS